MSYAGTHGCTDLSGSSSVRAPTSSVTSSPGLVRHMLTHALPVPGHVRNNLSGMCSWVTGSPVPMLQETHWDCHNPF